MKSLRDLLMWVGFSAWALVGFLGGLALAPTLSGSALDAGWSALIGGALGAGITVLGTVYITKSKDMEADRIKQLLIGETIAAVRDEAYVLVYLTEDDDVEDVADHGTQLMNQLNQLREALALFDLNMKDQPILNYSTRLSVFRLESVIRKNLAIFEKEEHWLKRPTRAVIENSRADLSFASTNIVEACVCALRDVGFSRDLPSDEDVEASLERLLPTE